MGDIFLFGQTIFVTKITHQTNFGAKKRKKKKKRNDVGKGEEKRKWIIFVKRSVVVVVVIESSKWNQAIYFLICRQVTTFKYFVIHGTVW